MIVTHILHFLSVQVLSALLGEHGRVEVLRVDLEYVVETMSEFARSHTNRCGVSSSRWTKEKDWVVSLLDDYKMMGADDDCLVSTMAAFDCLLRHSRKHCADNRIGGADCRWP